MTIRWLPGAERGLNEQIDYMADHNQRLAMRLGEAVRTAVDGLRTEPESGAPGRVADTRELAVAGTPLVVVYRLDEGGVLILRVLHGTKWWPPPPDC